jgi:cysteine desulfurase
VIYLDNSATTPLDPHVSRKMDEFRATSFANASSVHRGGQAARVALEDARERLAAWIGAEPKEIIFTSGGTEANNSALKGYFFRHALDGRARPSLITARSEHHAVLHPAEFLARLGCHVIFLDVDRQGRVLPDALGAALDALPAELRAVPPLVSVMHGNNESGAINPIARLAEVAHDRGAIFHTDAVQTFGKIPFTARGLGADMISISAHKIHGPKGIGALYVGKEVELEPLIHGGAQERNRRGGTEAVELAVGFDEAAQLACERIDDHRLRLRTLGGTLRARLAEIEGVRFVTPESEALPHIVTVTFDDAGRLDGEALIVGMDLRGIAVSNGSACTSGSPQPSHVLTAMGFSPAQAKAAVRFSLSRFTGEEEIAEAVEALADVLKTMRH